MISEENIKREFGEFLCRVSELMEEMKIPLSRVQLFWSGCVNTSIYAGSTCDSIPDFLKWIQQGPYAYRGLSALLTFFCGEEGDRLMAEYEEKLKLHLRSRVITNGKRFIVKRDRDMDERNELNFLITLAKLFECTTNDISLVDASTASMEAEAKTEKELTQKEEVRFQADTPFYGYEFAFSHLMSSWFVILIKKQQRLELLHLLLKVSLHEIIVVL